MDCDSYRETITGTAEADYCHKAAIGGSGEFALVKLRVEPTTFDGVEFVNISKPSTIPSEFIAGIEKELCKCVGPRAGFQMTGVKVTLIDGAYHEIDSSERVFRIAATKAFLKALEQARPKIVMAVMRVHVHVPEEFLGSVIGDINLRKGLIERTDGNVSMAEIEDLIPACNLEGYESAIESIADGRGRVSVTFDHYEPVSGDDHDPNFPGAMAMRVTG